MAESFQAQLQLKIDPLTYGLMGTLMIALRECGKDKQFKQTQTHTHTHTLHLRQAGLGDLYASKVSPSGQRGRQGYQVTHCGVRRSDINLSVRFLIPTF